MCSMRRGSECVMGREPNKVEVNKVDFGSRGSKRPEWGVKIHKQSYHIDLYF
jgi:hypothetical protein